MRYDLCYLLIETVFSFKFLIILEVGGGHVICAISLELASVHMSTPYRSD